MSILAICHFYKDLNHSTNQAIYFVTQFPHFAIAVSPRLEVESSGHAWLDGCNFQRKRLLGRQRHPVRAEMMREIYINSGTVTTLYFFNDCCNPNCVLIMQLFFLMKLHSFEDNPTLQGLSSLTLTECTLQLGVYTPKPLCYHSHRSVHSNHTPNIIGVH